MTRTAGSSRSDSTPKEAERVSSPPILDLGLLASAFARSLPLALAVGALISVLVGVVFASVTPTYATTTTVTVGTPSRAEKDAATMEALAAGMSEFVTDSRVRYYVQERSGQAVTLQGLLPDIEVSTTKIPGVIEVITRSKVGPDAASAMGRLVVDGMNLRANEVRDEFLASVEESTQKQIDDLNKQIALRRDIDPKADTSDLLRLVYEARATTATLQAGYSSASIIAQDDGSGQQIWPKPFGTGAVAGLVVTLVLAVGLAISRLRRSRRADSVWARSIGHRHGSVVDIDTASHRGMPPLTEAAVSAMLSAGRSVVILGAVTPVETPRGEGATGARLVVAPWDCPWWRELPASDVGLGVVVVDQGDRSPGRAESGVASFAEVGVPSRVVVRKPEQVGLGTGGDATPANRGEDG